MLSKSCNIAEFIEKAKGHSYEEVICMANEEATEAERRFYKLHGNDDGKKLLVYSTCLKDFILYMRHGVRTTKTRELELDAFREIRMAH